MFLSVILGMAISTIALPIIGQLVDLICSAIGIAQLKIQKKIVLLQSEIEELSCEESCATSPIGFQIPTEEDFIDDDNDE